MRKVTLVLAIVFVLFLTGSMWPISSYQPSYMRTENLCGEVLVTPDAEGILNVENRVESMSTNIPNSDETHIDQYAASRDPSQLRLKPNQSIDVSSDTGASPSPCPPDGSIYYSGGPPYAYIPTWTPKGSPGIQVPPPAPED